MGHGCPAASVKRGHAVLAAALGAVVAGALVGWADPARASGYALREGSTDWMANAFAGDASKAYDAATVWSNPAGMVRLTRAGTIDGSLDGIFPTMIHFRGVNAVGPTATTREPPQRGKPDTGISHRRRIRRLELLARPQIRRGPRREPAGQRVANPQDFVGRYQSLVSSITEVAVITAASWRINHQISIGGGPVFDYCRTRVTQAINTGPTAALTGDPVGDVRATTSARASTSARSISRRLTCASALPEPHPARHHRHAVDLHPAAAPGAQLRDRDGTCQPRTRPCGPRSRCRCRHDRRHLAGTAKLALLATVEWTDWSLFQSVNITPTNPALPGTVIQENWRNTWFFSVGANYRIMDRLMLQGGVGYDRIQ